MNNQTLLQNQIQATSKLDVSKYDHSVNHQEGFDTTLICISIFNMEDSYDTKFATIAMQRNKIEYSVLFLLIFTRSYIFQFPLHRSLGVSWNAHFLLSVVDQRAGLMLLLL